jgi:hypothetical protein
MNTYFVVRDTYHPQEDLGRNWSASIGGWDIADFVGNVYESAEEAQSAWDKWHDGDAPRREFRYHPAHGSFVPVHYEGLGAWALDADTLEESIAEAATFRDDLACVCGSGDGHFYAQNCVGFHKVREGKYVFEIKY